MKRTFIGLGLGIIFINSLLFFYFRPCGWIERNSGATAAIWNPGKYIIQGLEGYGIYRVDSRGYLNPEFDIDEIEYITVGSSYTQGKEVLYGNRYTDILNQKAADKMFYSVSQDGLVFPQIAKGFTALVSEFPNTKKIIIEIATTSFNSTELQSALEQREFKEEECGENILENMSLTSKLKIKIKEFAPLLSVIKKQLQVLESIQETEKIEEKNKTEDRDIELLEYEYILDTVLKKMKEVYQGEIIIVYHPTVSFQRDGEMLIAQKDTDVIFEKCCEVNDIKFLNISSAFLNAYEKNYIIPYGFMNTPIGYGHLNKYGHQIMADEIWKELNI